MIEIDVVKGGETSGRSAAASSTVSQSRPSPARTAVKANRKPSAVPSPPTDVASNRLLKKARAMAFVCQGFEERRQREPSLVDEGPRQKLDQRIDHEQRQQRPQHDDGDEQRRIAGDPAPSRHGLGPHRPLLRRQHFLDPALDDALAVGAGIFIVDRDDLGTLQHLGERGLSLHLGTGRNEVDLVLGELRLHRRTGREVDQLLGRRPDSWRP